MGEDSSCCVRACCPSARSHKESWIIDFVQTYVGPVPRVSSTLSRADRTGSWKARWGVGRMKYNIEPGLYALGYPTGDSPVLVTANYKMTFDRLRSEAGVDAWIMVLDTKGINVWCAAGKGTFGTEEIVRRLEEVRLKEVVSHDTLIIPQLGAPGVGAHEVTRRTGYRVVYGPVRAEDLGSFLHQGMKATQKMRRVRFCLKDRIVLIPMEIVGAARYALTAAVLIFLLSGLKGWTFSFYRALTIGIPGVFLLGSAVVSGAVVTPALLPWIPGRAFSLKGTLVGIIFGLVAFLYALGHPAQFNGLRQAAAWLLLIPVVSGFLALNFTGASNYTSLSGVRREIRLAAPLQAGAAFAGLMLWLWGIFI